MASPEEASALRRWWNAVVGGLEEALKTGTAIGGRVFVVALFVVLAVVVTSLLSFPGWAAGIVAASAGVGATLGTTRPQTPLPSEPLPTGGLQEGIAYLGRLRSASRPAQAALHRPSEDRTQNFMNVFAISGVREVFITRGGRECYPCVWTTAPGEFLPVSPWEIFEDVDRDDLAVPIRQSAFSSFFYASNPRDVRDELHSGDLKADQEIGADYRALSEKGFRALYAVRIVEPNNIGTVAIYGVVARDAGEFNPAQRNLIGGMAGLLSIVWDASPPPSQWMAEERNP